MMQETDRCRQGLPEYCCSACFEQDTVEASNTQWQRKANIQPSLSIEDNILWNKEDFFLFQNLFF